MITKIFYIAMLIIGLTFFIFGLRLLFEKGYVEKRYIDQSKNDHGYNKYGRGVQSAIVGLMMIIASILVLLS